MQNKFIVNSKDKLLEFCEQIVDIWADHKYLTITVSDKRSLDQNAAIRVAYSQIAKHRDDMTLKDVERHCKLNYGVPILQSDPVHGYVFDSVLAKINHEQQLKVMDCFKITSEMNTEQAKEFINQLLLDFPFVEIKT